jgi:hypothetical protein
MPTNSPRRRNREWLYATVPDKWVWPYPAIRHRHENNDYGLSPFEFAIVLAVINLARMEHQELEHRDALLAGQAQIKEEKERRSRHREEWAEVQGQRQRGVQARAPTMMRTDGMGLPRYKPIPLKEALKNAGADGYAKRRKHKQPPPDLLAVRTSKRALLAAARLTNNSRNNRRIDAALDRLTQPVAGTRGALLNSWQARPLILQVAGCWLDPPYTSLPLPLPLHSPTALALYVFLHGVRTGMTNTHAIDFGKLCYLLGIGGEWNNRQRDLNRATAAVNAHLAKLPDDDARQLFDRYNIKVAERYQVYSEGPKIRFEAVSRLPRWQKEDHRRRQLRELSDEGTGETISEPVPPRRARRLAEMKEEMRASFFENTALDPADADDDV